MVKHIGYALLILVFFLVLAIGRLLFQERNRNEEDTRISMDSLAFKLKEYKRHCGSFPSSSEGLEALTSKVYPANCKDVPTEGFLEGGIVPIDSWDQKYKYTSDGRSFSISTSSEEYEFIVTDKGSTQYKKKDH